jgi:hypothetical protein
MGFAIRSDVERLRASIDRLEIAYCFMPLTPKSFAKYTDLSFIIQPAKGKGDRVQALQHIPKTVILPPAILAWLSVGITLWSEREATITSALPSRSLVLLPVFL